MGIRWQGDGIELGPGQKHGVRSREECLRLRQPARLIAATLGVSLLTHSWTPRSGGGLTTPLVSVRSAREDSVQDLRAGQGCTGALRTYSLREIWNVIFYQGRNGCSWRALP